MDESVSQVIERKKFGNKNIKIRRKLKNSDSDSDVCLNQLKVFITEIRRKRNDFSTIAN